jgi:hypothetical protein
MKRIFIGAALALLGAVSIQAADARINVSSVIDKATAESLLGEKIKDLSPRNGDGKDGYYSKCNYYTVSRSKSLLVRVHLPVPGAIDPQKELELVAASSGPMKAVEGVGDKAQVFSGGGESGAASRMLMLYVAKGNAFLTIGLGGFEDESVATDIAKTIAQKLLERL